MLPFRPVKLILCLPLLLMGAAATTLPRPLRLLPSRRRIPAGATRLWVAKAAVVPFLLLLLPLPLPLRRRALRGSR